MNKIEEIVLRTLRLRNQLRSTFGVASLFFLILGLFFVAIAGQWSKMGTGVYLVALVAVFVALLVLTVRSISSIHTVGDLLGDMGLNNMRAVRFHYEGLDLEKLRLVISPSLSVNVTGRGELKLADRQCFTIVMGEELTHSFKATHSETNEVAKVDFTLVEGLSLEFLTHFLFEQSGGVVASALGDDERWPNPKKSHKYVGGGLELIKLFEGAIKFRLDRSIEEGEIPPDGRYADYLYHLAQGIKDDEGHTVFAELTVKQLTVRALTD